MRKAKMRAVAIGFAALLAGCVSTPGIEGGFRAPSFVALQQMCGGEPVDFGADAPAVYSASFDAYVATRRGKLTHEQFCAFEAGLAQHHATLANGNGKANDSEARNRWVAYLNEQRAQAVSWRASVDPTLRAG